MESEEKSIDLSIDRSSHVNKRKINSQEIRSEHDEQNTNYKRKCYDELTSNSSLTSHNYLYENSMNVIDSCHLLPSNISATSIQSDPSRVIHKQSEARFLWTSDKTSMLIDTMLSYKQSMVERGLNFQANLFNFYSEIRNRMALVYPADDFGPPLSSGHSVDKFGRCTVYRSKIELPKSMVEGYHRIKNKIKSLRNGLVRAKIKNSFDGLNKSVMEFYDKLNELFGDVAAASTKLPDFKSHSFAHPNSAQPNTDASFNGQMFQPNAWKKNTSNIWPDFTQIRLMQAGLQQLNLSQNFYNLTVANTTMMIQCADSINKALRIVTTEAQKLNERACFMTNIIKLLQQSQANTSRWSSMYNSESSFTTMDKTDSKETTRINEESSSEGTTNWMNSQPDQQ